MPEPALVPALPVHAHHPVGDADAPLHPGARTPPGGRRAPDHVTPTRLGIIRRVPVLPGPPLP